MTAVHVSHIFFQWCLFVCLTNLIVFAKTEECDKSTCRGPIRYYESLGCTPVYKNPGDCCAERYDCDHLKQRSRLKCYVNGHKYELNEALREEDRNVCDFNCKCMELDGIASFVCAGYDCVMYGPSDDDCYYPQKPDQCCHEPHPICPTAEARPTCEVEGKTYRDGESFNLKSEPNKICSCMAGYKGENIEPFCITANRSICAPDFRKAGNVYRNCAPIFYDLPAETSCSSNHRCPEKEDLIIHNSVPSDRDDLVCNYGNITMHIGDELKTSTYSHACLKCICELPPVVTCRYLPNKSCLGFFTSL